MNESGFTGKTIMVTGAAGTIGSEIVRALLPLRPQAIRLFDNRETELFNLQQELRGHEQSLRLILGDIRDHDQLRKAMRGVDIVFHAAALKHVPLCEFNPFEAAKTNVLGTKNVIESALEANVERVVAISTDKAVAPMNTMGATKLLAEKLVSNAHLLRGRGRTIFTSVRFGNVLKSRGSLVEIFNRQIQQGGPVTITDENMTRFVMSPRQAVSLVLRAAEVAKGGEVFVLKMPVIRLGDLASALVDEIAPAHGFTPSSIRKEIIGARPGERMHEFLMTAEEGSYALETEDMFIIPLTEYSKHYPVSGIEAYAGARKASLSEYSTSRTPPLAREKIVEFLRREDLVPSNSRTPSESLKTAAGAGK